jgi:hypothetical protein
MNLPSEVVAFTWMAFFGTLIFGCCVAAAALWLLLWAVKQLEVRDPITQPQDVAERLGALTPGTVFSDTAQKRAASKRRLDLVAQKARGPARLMTFSPKDVA